MIIATTSCGLKSETWRRRKLFSLGSLMFIRRLSSLPLKSMIRSWPRIMPTSQRTRRSNATYGWKSPNSCSKDNKAAMKSPCKKPWTSSEWTRSWKWRTYWKSSQKKPASRTWKNICASVLRITNLRFNPWGKRSRRIRTTPSSCATKSATNGISTSRSTLLSVVIYAMRPSSIVSSTFSRVCMPSTESASPPSCATNRTNPRMRMSRSLWISWTLCTARSTPSKSGRSNLRAITLSSKRTTKVKIKAYCPAFLTSSLSQFRWRVVFRRTCQCKMNCSSIRWFRSRSRQTSSAWCRTVWTRLTTYSRRSASFAVPSSLTWLTMTSTRTMISQRVPSMTTRTMMSGRSDDYISYLLL